MSQTESSLKPCPFCGGEAIEQFEDAGTVHEAQPERSDIYCSKCNVGISGGELNETRKAWNTRQPTSADSELNETSIMLKLHEAYNYGYIERRSKTARREGAHHAGLISVYKAIKALSANSAGNEAEQCQFCYEKEAALKGD